MKVQGFEHRLFAAVEAARRLPFEWGAHDCATWAFDVVGQITDSQTAADAWRGKYTTAAGAARVRRALGWRSMADMGVALLGQPLSAPTLAQRGDLVLDGSGNAFGICLGAQVAFLAEAGLTMYPLRSCQMAWRV